LNPVEVQVTQEYLLLVMVLQFHTNKLLLHVVMVLMLVFLHLIILRN